MSLLIVAPPVTQETRLDAIGRPPSPKRRPEGLAPECLMAVAAHVASGVSVPFGSENLKRYYAEHPRATMVQVGVGVAWFDILGILALAAALGLWGGASVATRVLIGAIGVLIIGFFTGAFLLAVRKYRRKVWPASSSGHK